MVEFLDPVVRAAVLGFRVDPVLRATPKRRKKSSKTAAAPQSKLIEVKSSTVCMHYIST